MTMSARAELLKAVNKKYGDGTLIRGAELKNRVIPRITTGSLSFDIMLGGGWPVNQWNEVIGNPSAGKTVMALKTVAANQALNPKFEVLWIAAEQFVPDWAEASGVQLDRVDLIETNIMEHAYEIIVQALDFRAYDLIVVDSLPALVPGEEAEKEVKEHTVALGAKLTAKFYRKTGKTGRRSMIEEDRPWTGLVINQWREKIGVMFGDPRTTPGGQAKDFEYFTRVEVARDEWILNDRKLRVGISMKAKTIKNKVSAAHRAGSVDFYFDEVPGFNAGDYDSFKELFFVAQSYGIIEQGGGIYKFAGDKIGKGATEALQTLRSAPELRDAVEEEVRRAAAPDPIETGN
jgi:recombination protein RecA